MAITLDQALQQAENELNRARSEVKSLEGRRQQLLMEIQQEHAKNQTELERIRVYVAREREKIMKDMPGLREEISRLKAERDALQDTVSTLKVTQDESIREHERLVNVAKAEVTKALQDKQEKLAAILSTYHQFKLSLPEIL